MDITVKNIAPYFSLLLAEQKPGVSAKEIHAQVMKSVKDSSEFPDSFIETFTSSNILSMSNAKYEDGAEYVVSTYRADTKPSWIIESDVKDQENHVVAVFALGRFAALYFSQKGFKDKIRDLFDSLSIPSLSSVDIHKLFNNFVNEDKIKMLWLLGTQGRNSSKAQSKVLAGNSVADTLDPLSDQSYMMSAARTEISTSQDAYTIGINPYRSSVWRGFCSSWSKFEDRVLEILDILNSSTSSSSTNLSILANPISDINDIEDVYDLCFTDPELFENLLSPQKIELLRCIEESYSFEITQAMNRTQIPLKVFFENKEIGDINVVPAIIKNDLAFTVISINTVGGYKRQMELFCRVFKSPELVCCWYESGHTLINGRAFKIGYRDVEHKGLIYCDFSGFDITKEKPGTNKKKPDLKRIGFEDSLFCWVKKHWNGEWLTDEQYQETTKPKGWLFCDDGAGEKADFIHAIEFNGELLISLLHVKASKSKSLARGVSVGAHDVVLNQAVKNIKHCSRKNLITELTARLDNSIDKMCWLNGVIQDPKDFVSYLSGFNKISKVRYKVVVIQPHTLKSTYESSKDKNTYKQLTVLLVNADHAVRSTGSTFHVVGCFG